MNVGVWVNQDELQPHLGAWLRPEILKKSELIVDYDISLSLFNLQNSSLLFLKSRLVTHGLKIQRWTGSCHLGMYLSL